MVDLSSPIEQQKHKALAEMTTKTRISIVSDWVFEHLMSIDCSNLSEVQGQDNF